MGEEVKIEVIRSTQNSLSKYIKKPPLTEKLLRKPPFRYLHDITTAKSNGDKEKFSTKFASVLQNSNKESKETHTIKVMRETGYLQGLYTQDELNPENIKDREAKIAFLHKLIAAVNLSTGISITARPNKIVAGLDVAKTNELLQVIGKALDKKIDSSKAVEQILNKKSKGTTQQKKDNTKDKTSKETKAADTKSRDSRNSETQKRKSKEKVKNVEKPEHRKGKQSKDISPTKLAKPASNKESPKEVTKVDDSHKEENNSEVPALAVAEKPPVAQNENVPETEKHNDPEPKHDVKPPPPSPAIDLEQPDHKEVREHRKEKTKREKYVDKTEGLEIQEVSTKEQEIKSTDTNLKEDISKSGDELKRPQSARAVHRKKVQKKPNVSEGVGSHEDKKEDVLSPEKIITDPTNLSAIEKKPLQQETSQSESTSVGVVARESKRPRTAARPASARPGAPRVRDRGTILLKDSDNKEVSEPVNLIVDSKDLPKDDDETLVTVEAPSTEAVVDQVVGESHLLSGDQGHLVSQILETQKELEENSENGPESVNKVDISWSSGRQEAMAREVEKLRSAIQALTRAVNPLGKLIDFLQEDVDSMQTELETWVAANQQLAQQLLAEQRLTEECIEPLARQLEDIEQLVEEQLEEMSVVKANIIRNDERLAALLRTNTSRVPG